MLCQIFALKCSKWGWWPLTVVHCAVPFHSFCSWLNKQTNNKKNSYNLSLISLLSFINLICTPDTYLELSLSCELPYVLSKMLFPSHLFFSPGKSYLSFRVHLTDNFEAEEMFPYRTKPYLCHSSDHFSWCLPVNTSSSKKVAPEGRRHLFSFPFSCIALGRGVWLTVPALLEQ